MLNAWLHVRVINFRIIIIIIDNADGTVWSWDMGSYKTLTQYTSSGEIWYGKAQCGFTV